MKSMYLKLALFILIIGLLTACGVPPTAAPAATSEPTETTAPATETPTEVATEPATEAPTEAATEAPATEAPATEASAATQPAAEGATVSFANDIMPIIQSRCLNCHGGRQTQEGLDMNTHANLMAGSDNGPVVIPGDAVHSLFVELVATHEMPKRGPKLTPPQVQLFTDWVNQGALDN